MDLKICSFNCCSLRKNIDLVRQLTENSFDVIMLQETMVTEEHLGILDYIDENYESVGIAATFSDIALTTMAGRPRGGLACLWRSNSSFIIEKV